MPIQPRIAVLEHDPDLAGALVAEQFDAARAQVSAPSLHFPKGPWPVRSGALQAGDSLGLLVLDGLLVRKVSVGPRACAELLGPGDVLQPWLQVTAHSSVSVEVDWDAAETVTVAVLDRQFVTEISPWPEIITTLTARALARSHWLAFHLAVCHIRRVEDRLLLVMWHIADRWGRMTPRGVEISITLPHWLLGCLVGARRPAVSLALKALTDQGTVERQARSRWRLHGEPPTSYRQLHSDAARRRLPACSEPG